MLINLNISTYTSLGSVWKILDDKALATEIFQDSLLCQAQSLIASQPYNNDRCRQTLTIATERSSLSLQSDCSSSLLFLRSTTLSRPSPLVASKVRWRSSDNKLEMKSLFSFKWHVCFQVLASQSCAARQIILSRAHKWGKRACTDKTQNQQAEYSKFRLRTLHAPSILHV